MKRLLAIALVAAGVALPVCAQRGGSRGGFSGQSASSFHGSSVPATHFNSSGGPSFGGSRFASAAPAYRSGYGASLRLRPVRPLPIIGRGRFYGAGIPYGYGASWVAPYYLGYPDTDAYDGPASGPVDDGSQSYVASPQYQGPPPDQGPLPDQGPPPAEAYQAYSEPATPQSPPAPLAPEDAVTLIFKDGRPPEQIHNYALTRTTLYVRDQHKRDIPVADLDLAATEKANRNAGVEFELPATK